jgi:hypothetical protein
VLCSVKDKDPQGVWAIAKISFTHRCALVSQLVQNFLARNAASPVLLIWRIGDSLNPQFKFRHPRQEDDS